MMFHHFLGLFVSLPFLIVTLLVYALIPELRNVHGKCMMCYLTNMVIGYTLIPMVLLKNHYDSPMCEILAYVTYYTILLNFFWVNVICFDIWWTFSQFRVADREEEDQKFVWYLIYGFGAPLFLVLFEVLMDNVSMNPISPKVGANGCFFIGE
jgi:G protein-coupled receptor Mth (Methuselah protein)